MSLVEKTKSRNKLQSITRIIILNIDLFNSFQNTVPKHSFQWGGLDFGSYEPFEDPRDTLVQQWLKFLIPASGFVCHIDYVTERVRITRSVKLRTFL